MANKKASGSAASVEGVAKAKKKTATKKTGGKGAGRTRRDPPPPPPPPAPPLLVPVHQLAIAPLPAARQALIISSRKKDGTLTLYLDLTTMTDEQIKALDKLLSTLGTTAVILGATATPGP